MTSQIQATPSYAHIRAPNWNNGQASSQASNQIETFHDLPLSDEMFAALDKVGYAKPTPVQGASIPLGLAGIDLIVQSRTGTGKTAAFAIPAIETLDTDNSDVEVLVLAPTRELAQQVAGEFERLCSTRQVAVASIYGGTSYDKQLRELKSAKVICATPGRMLDLLKRRAVSLANLKFFILDEADEMLNMGFEKELNAIVEFLPENRQNLLFSATVDEDIKTLASHILSFPEYVTFSGDGAMARKVDHIYYMVTGLGRLRDLIKVLEFEQPENAIIFANTRDDTFLVANFLKKHKYNVEVINGELQQRDRERVLEKLRRGQVQYLVATDVAARGIDISDLSHVFNLQLPDSSEVYVHRTGRTGRAGKSGVAISLISPREIGNFYVLKRLFNVDFSERELPTHEALLEAKKKRALASVLDKLQQEQSLDYASYLAQVDALLDDEDAKITIAKLLAFFDQGAPELIYSADPLPPLAPAAPKRRPEPPAPEDDATDNSPQPSAGDPTPSEEASDDTDSDDAYSDDADSADDDYSDDDADSDDDYSDDDADSDDAYSDDEEPEAAVSPPDEDEEDEDNEEEEVSRSRRRRRGRGRRRRNRRDRSDDDDYGDDDEEAARPESRHARDNSSRTSTQPEPKPEPKPEPPPSSDPPPRRRRRHKEIPPPPSKAKTDDPPKKESAPDRNLDDQVKERVYGEKALTWLHINLGRSKLDDEQAAIDLVCELAGIEDDDCGKAILRSRWCYVQVREDMVDDIIDALSGQKVSKVTLKAAVARNEPKS